MYYEFSVARGDHHLFATAERCAKTEEKANALQELLKEKFPPEEGYVVIRAEVTTTLTAQPV